MQTIFILGMLYFLLKSQDCVQLRQKMLGSVILLGVSESIILVKNSPTPFGSLSDLVFFISALTVIACIDLLKLAYELQDTAAGMS